ncbi:MAG: DNRLRE domain-containing protein [Phycisphaerales bacterium]|nr:DNRLRE domain-containing protein [Phycisphaerales bacterium]
MARSSQLHSTNRRTLLGSVLLGCTAIGLAATPRAAADVAVFQQGLNGYQGTVDTWLNADSPDSSYGNWETKVSDDDWANSFWSDYAGQALLRFDGIAEITSIGGVIPIGSTVTNATLRFHLACDIDHPFYDPDFYLFEVVRSWSEQSTWNSLSGGLSQPEDLDQHVGTFLGDNEPEEAAERSFDITWLVQAWVAGQPNWGIAVLPQIINGNDDGIEIWSSECQTQVLRPSLEVHWTPPPPPPPNLGDLNGDGVVNGVDLGMVLGYWGIANSPGDANNDGLTDAADLSLVISGWGG